MTKTVRNRLLGFVLAAVIFAVDQALKWVVDYPLNMRMGDTIDWLPFFAFTRTHNHGVSLGMFTANSPEMRWGLVAVTGLIAIGVTVWLLRERKLGDILPLGMVLGGALGNIRDRVRLGYVLDYADLHFGAIRPFLIFNVADACITIGVLIILARSLFMREKPAETQSDAAKADQPAETH
uniref:signal peptidase II n=1 Tax=Altererythrobacter segetis TaxID=1104773 RepID=UPI00140AB239|nr:signal peptidase II [Altererythrobacter segetis]